MRQNLHRKLGWALAPLLVAGCNTLVSQARTSHDQGLVHLKAGQVEQSIQAFEQARALLAKAPESAVGRPLTLRVVNDLALANAYRKVGKLRQARATYEGALSPARQLRHPLLLAALLNNLASLLLAVDRTDEALARWREAKQALADEQDLQLLAQIHNGLGSCLLGRYAPRAAEKEFLRARTCARQRAAHEEIALALNGLARAAAMSGDLAGADELFDDASRLAEEHGLTSAATTTQVNAAAQAMRRGQYRVALERLDAIRDRVAAVASLEQRSALLHNLGGVYLSAGLAQEALVYYRQASRLADDPAFALSTAAALYAADDPAGAEQELRRAARLLGPKDPRRAEVGWLGGWIALQQGHADQAAAAIERVCRDRGARRGDLRAQCGFGRAVLALEQGRAQPAARLARESLQRFERLGDQQGALKSRLVLARAQERAGDVNAALQTYLEASEGLEQLRPSFGSELLKMGYLASRSQVYTRALRLLADRLPGSGQPAGEVADQVLQLMERSRGRGQLDLIHQGRLLARSPAAPKLQRDVARRLLRVQRLQRELSHARQAAVVERLEGQLAEALRRLDASRLRLLASLPKAGLASARPEATLKELGQLCQTSGRALVSYYLTEEVGLVLAVTGKGHVIRRLADPAAVVRRVSLLTHLVRGRQDGPEYRQAFTQLAHQLYRDLVEPVQDLVRGAPLVISTHGSLTHLPFQLLLTEPPSRPVESPDFFATLGYLIHRHAISYTPSLAVWSALRQIPSGARKAVGQALELGSFLGLGDPRRRQQVSRPETTAPWMDLRGLRAIRHLLRGGALPPLPHGRKEVMEVARVFTRGRARTYLGRSATERALKNALGEHPFRFVHIAAHGLIDEEQPELSSIVLAPGGGEDGLLELTEIYDLPLRGAELTVLSACQTALGQQVSGEGIVGLVRGFLAAGSQNVMASLWSVSDHSTRLLMARFYQRLKQGAPLVSALHQAQRAGARGELGAAYAHPFYWAPFGLHGRGDGS